MLYTQYIHAPRLLGIVFCLINSGISGCINDGINLVFAEEHVDGVGVGNIQLAATTADNIYIPPFGGCGGPEPLMTVRSNILRGNFDFQPADVWGLVSQKAKKFICALLVIDPKARPTAREAQKQEFSICISLMARAHYLGLILVCMLLLLNRF